MKNTISGPSLYDPRFDKDSCGVGFVANISGKKSHAILEKGIQSVVNLTHRGAIDADAKTGDGAGILTQIPRKLFLKEVEKLGHRPPKEEDLAVGMIFLPSLEQGVRGFQTQERCRAIIEDVLSHHRIKVFGWRQVPVDPSCLGEKAATTQPEIEQILMGRPSHIPSNDFERTLYLVRKEIEKHIREESIESFYIPSFSSQTIVYKGLFVATQLKKFYPDLKNPDYETAVCLFHQRYSTNTFPNWFLAQPFRFLGHNGEINTLQGNRNWMRAREPELSSPLWKEKIENLKPVVWLEGSDSASLDNVLELLVNSGRDILHSMTMLVPEAWQNMPNMEPKLKAFYQYHACLIEPWDGPAALAFSDGKIVGACLDRNGLRPARYALTKDGMVVMGSEVGIVELDDSRIVEKGRLGPGKMIAVDMEKGVLLRGEESKQRCCLRRPYEEWVKEHLIPLEQIVPAQDPDAPTVPSDQLKRHQTVFGYTSEELDMVLRPMASEAKEAVFSMGDDIPLSVLSKKPKLLYTYFKQLFAQVTNPPIDSLREKLVMSLNSIIGHRKSVLEETPEHTRQILLKSPFLFNHELEALKKLKDPEFQAEVLPCLFEVNDGPEGLEKALNRLCEAADLAVDKGIRILILSDRGVDASHAAIPMLLAVASIHHHLIRQGKRMKANLIAQTAEARDVHHFALLIGYGATAFNPYLTFESIQELIQRGEIQNVDYQTCLKNYKKAIDDGILKIMSKMGISTVGSYRGAQIFEAIGLSRALVEHAFTGTSSRIGGIGLKEIAQDILTWHGQAFHGDVPNLEFGGFVKFRRDGEYHAFNPEVIKWFHQAVRNKDYEAYKKYASLVNNRPATALRDLLDFKKAARQIPLEEVESIEEIRKRFTTAGMSHGALSREAHETLAVALNRIGGKSNSGEGGEDPARYPVRENGDWPNSAIKQIASARFGVTPEYAARCIELEIKMAQGSKPGEGGQLPGIKVSGEIARIRFAQPGTTLISPPPHHDIYSIEDLSQLIYDLKQVNPRAKVCVKLVAEVGVGTVAAGVAKAHADVVLISGHDGGTGASPLSSIKYAGMPWELGVSEAQQVLVLNDLRGRITVRTDGGMKTGRHLVVAALLGAEEFNFGTAAVVATGCVMARQCHLNTCPTGVATQDPKLRAKFTGNADMVVNFFNFVAQEVREILSELGFRKLDEIIGRTELLLPKPITDHPKADTLDLSPIVAQADPHGKRPRHHIQDRNDWIDDVPLDLQILKDSKLALEGGGSIRLTYPIRNTNRAVGTRLSGEIAYRYGDAGLPFGEIALHFRGTAGQSFGAFLIRGVRLILTGEANDYVGKAMGGGEIVIAPPANASFTSHQNVIMGNTVLYGATGGTLFAAGRAGERFAVRNSGSVAVVEGVGDHGCEYMTGGAVVVLGETGRNFGAGMTGGIAYVLDLTNSFPKKLNAELVALERLQENGDVETLLKLIRRHAEATKSRHSKEILDHFETYKPLFWKVLPKTQVKKVEASVAVKP